MAVKEWDMRLMQSSWADVNPWRGCVMIGDINAAGDKVAAVSQLVWVTFFYHVMVTFDAVFVSD